MTYQVSTFLKNNDLNISKYFNCYCKITRIKAGEIEYSRKNPFKIIFQDESIVFIGINSQNVKEYHFDYKHIIDSKEVDDKLIITVQDFYYADTKFEFEFLFVFDKYILDAFSVEKQDFETLLEKNIYIEFSRSWFDERKEAIGILKKVGDLRIKVEDSNKYLNEVEIFDINFFFAKL